MKKAISIAIILLMLVSGFVVMVDESTGSRSNAEISSVPENPEPMLTSHAPIRINNNSDLAAIASSGSGTQADPYIIENYDTGQNRMEDYDTGMSEMLVTSNTRAAAYYMPDDFPNLQAAFAAMSGGDTLIIRDGVYTGENNTIFPWNYPPSGSEEAGYTTIEAEHMGKVVFDGEGLRQLININGNGMDPQPSYLQFEGIVFRNSSQQLVGFVYVNHIKIIKCFLYDANNTDGQYADSLFFRYANYGLIEDTSIWGNGRYHFYILDSNHFVLRRCIDRYDRGIAVGYSNMGSFRIYSTSNTELQNCISIDGDQNNFYLQHSDSGLIPAVPKSYWPAGANGPTDNVHIKGSFALNNRGMSMYILSPQWTPENNTVENSVFWDGYNGLWSRVERPESTLFEHLTVGKIKTGTEYSGIRGEYGYSIIARNNIIYGCGTQSNDYVLTWTDNPNSSSDYNVLFNNTNNYQTNHGAHPKPHDFCLENGNEVDPLTGNPGNGIPALKYLPRIEDGSDLDGSASDGGDRGATILYKIGRDGTLWGEPGWNETTNESLWPWPNEDIIKEQMKSYIYDEDNDGIPEIRGDRGFCADGKQLNGVDDITLTSYIWEYLGNPIPADIYGIGEIRGRVVDEDENPIEGATITLYTGESTATDENGEFTIPVDAGNHTITISKEGYEDKTVSVDVGPGETITLPPTELPKAKNPSGEFPWLYLILLIIIILAVIALFMAKRKKPQEMQTESEEATEEQVDMSGEGKEDEGVLPSEGENIEGKESEEA